MALALQADACCCSTSRWPACPPASARTCCDTVAALPADVSVLLIEHDMDLVFSFADRMTVLVNGAVLTEGDAATRSPPTRRSRRCTWATRSGERSGAWLNALLEVDGLTCGYGEAVVLSDVSFTLDDGRTLALLGRNGTGKTTLINTLVGVTRRHAGRIVLGGRGDRTRCRRTSAPRAGIGWVPQERNIFKSLTVHENLTAVARPGPWTVQRVYAMFPRLAERKRNLGTQLSGGEQQMLAFGRALVLNPRLLLLDEPLEGLAPHDRGGAAARDPPRRARGGPVVDHRRAASAHGAAASPTTRSCSTAAASPTAAPARRCWPTRRRWTPGSASRVRESTHPLGRGDPSWGAPSSPTASCPGAHCSRLRRCSRSAAAPRAEFPNRPLKVIVPQPPGGGFDFVGRTLADTLQPSARPSVVVENRPGSGTLVGTDAAAKATPDGYSLLVGLGIEPRAQRRPVSEPAVRPAARLRADRHRGGLQLHADVSQGSGGSTRCPKSCARRRRDRAA